MTAAPAPYADLVETVPLGTASRIVDETVRYEHEGTPLEGYLAVDAGLDGRRPGILVVHDWTGLQDYPKARAQMLARLGYVGFAIDVYGAGVRPTGDAAPVEARKYYGDLELMRARVRAGYDALLADDRVDPDRVAIIGYCFGGSAAFEFARTGARLRGAVSFHGSLVTHDPADVAAIDAPLLALTGAADPVVPDEALVAFEDELRTRDDLDWQIVSYSGAPHAFTIPGQPNHRPLADARSWRAMVDFLTEVLA
jgi:dienelactone hydrolase